MFLPGNCFNGTPSWVPTYERFYVNFWTVKSSEYQAELGLEVQLITLPNA